MGIINCHGHTRIWRMEHPSQTHKMSCGKTLVKSLREVQWLQSSMNTAGIGGHSHRGVGKGIGFHFSYRRQKESGGTALQALLVQATP